MTTTIRVLLLAAAACVVAAPAHAQQRDLTAAPLAWVGCWEPMDALPGSGMTCIVPSADLGTLRVLEVAGPDVKEVSRLVLDGERHAVTAEGCEGWERARLSAGGGRILLDAEVSCAGLPKQQRSGAFLITPRGDWLQVQGSGFDAVSNARVRLFRENVALLALPAEVRAGLSPVLGMAEATRANLARQKLSASDLLELASMNVAAPVIDVIVAAGFPKAFMLDPAGSADVAAAPAEARTGSLASARPVLYPGYYGFGYPGLYLDQGPYSMCGVNMWGMYDYSYCARTSQWSRYGYGGYYGYGFGSGWIPGYGYGGGVIVVVRPTDPTPRESGGRVVRGQGYTQGGSASTSGGSTAQPRTRATSSDARSAGSSSGSSSASSGSSSTSSSTERTAQPRKP